MLVGIVFNLRQTTLVSPMTCLLSHLSDLLIHTFHNDGFNFANRHAVNCLLLLCLLALHRLFLLHLRLHHLLVSEVAGLFGLVETCFKTFILTFGYVLVRD